ncbi:MAG: hypothetical protein J5379_03625 [Clostridiales bacterium]|nr:hypothetical protein [Clostridiales bacterium]
MDTVLLIRVIVMIAGIVGAVILCFAGFKGTNRELKKDEGTNSIPKPVLIKSTLLLVGAILCVVLAYIAMHYPDYQDGVCSFSELIIGCLVSVVRSLGWIALIPWLLNLFRITGSPRRNDTDKM